MWQGWDLLLPLEVIRLLMELWIASHHLHLFFPQSPKMYSNGSEGPRELQYTQKLFQIQEFSDSGCIGRTAPVVNSLLIGFFSWGKKKFHISTSIGINTAKGFKFNTVILMKMNLFFTFMGFLDAILLPVRANCQEFHKLDNWEVSSKFVNY